MKKGKKEKKGEGCYNFGYLVRYPKRLVEVRQATVGAGMRNVNRLFV